MRLRSAILHLALAAPLAAWAQPSAREDDDAARARAGVSERRMVPLTSILDWIEKRYEGHAIEVELEGDPGEPPTYEVEWLVPDGKVLEFEFDAATGALLEIEGPEAGDAER